jgi:anti-sigma-K factor RskA
MTADRDQLAAEYALGVLDGDELSEAQALERSDPEFRAAAGRWSGRLAPLLNEVPAVEPPAGLWAIIWRRLPPVEEKSNVVVLRRRVTTWKAATAGVTAIAASLAFVLATRPPLQPVEPARMPMVAMLGNSGGAKLVASWSPGDRMLVVAASADMPPDTEHAHELWVMRPGGKPRSLGVMPSGRHMMMKVPESISAEFRSGAMLAVTMEPPGGSPTGVPTGAMLVSGRLENA